MRNIGKRMIAAMLSIMMLSSMSLGNVTAADLTDATTYQVVINASEHGTVSLPEGAQETYQAGEEVLLNAIPEEGYAIGEVSAMETETEEMVTVTEKEDGTYSFVMPEANVTVKAAFSVIDEEPVGFSDEGEGDKKTGEDDYPTEPATCNPGKAMLGDVVSEITVLPEGVSGMRSRAAVTSAYITWGETINYFDWFTRRFQAQTANGTFTAYCLEPPLFPEAGTHPVRVLNDNRIKALFYTSPEGVEPGSWWNDVLVDNTTKYGVVHAVASFFYTGNTDGFYDGGPGSAYDTIFRAIPNIINAWLSNPANVRKLDNYVAYVADGGSTQDIAWLEPVPSGYAKLVKISAKPEITEGNDCYSLEGAEYGVYSNSACTTKVGTLKTKADGSSNTIELDVGTYYVKETKAPKGYALDPTRYTVKVTSNKTTTLNVKDAPQNDPVDIVLGKYDGEKTYVGEGNLPQGSATLEGAEYTYQFYGGYYDTVEELKDKTPLRTWVLKTNKNGFIRFNKNFLVGGDEFWTDSKGNVTLPLGTVTVQETKAPEGYNLNDEIFLRQITTDGSAENVNTYNTPQVAEDVIRGDVEIIKVYQPDDNKEDVLEPIEGVEFTITSDTTGEEVMKIVTDKEGKATTKTEEHPRGSLVYDTYTITETKTPEGYNPIKPFKVTISEEQLTLTGIYRQDTLITSPVQIVKVDAGTGKVIPVAGTTFQLLDKDKKVIEMTTYYPHKVTYDTFTTDENGQLVFPEMLKYGTYYLREVQAPEGYLLNEKEIEFKLTKEADWENPLIIKVEDENAMGKIKINKIDFETGEALAGAKFKVVAREDITTQDGTLRYSKGEVVDTLVTDENGEAETKELFLGKYFVKETSAPSGYVLNDTKYKVELKYKDQTTAVVTETVKDIPNKPNKITIQKVKKDSDKKLKGVRFAVWNQADVLDEDELDGGMINYQQFYETDENGEIVLKYLTPGTYSVMEVETIDGFVLNEDVYEFTVDKKGFVNGKEEDTLKIENDYTKVKISKTDITTGEELPGATLQIIDKDGNVVEEWISEEEPNYVEELPAGDYVLREITAPDGYEVAADVTFTVESTGDIQIVEMKDEPVKENVTPVRTGDDRNSILLMILFVLSGCILIVRCRKKFAER